MCALITLYKTSSVQAEQSIQFITRHVVITCLDRKWRPGFQLAKLYVCKALAGDIEQCM